MANLLTETRREIEYAKQSPDDIIFIGNSRQGYRCSWAEFERLADKEYDDGFGGHEVAIDLEIVFSNGGRMKRHEYDGSEWWIYTPPFKMPTETKPITNLFGPDLERANEEEQL